MWFDNDQKIIKCATYIPFKEGGCVFYNVTRSCRINFKPYDAGMLIKFNCSPITEVLIQSHQYAPILNTILQNFMIISGRQTDLARTHNVESISSQYAGNRAINHLIK